MRILSTGDPHDRPDDREKAIAEDNPAMAVQTAMTA